MTCLSCMMLLAPESMPVKVSGGSEQCHRDFPCWLTVRNGTVPSSRYKSGFPTMQAQTAPAIGMRDRILDAAEQLVTEDGART